jgi:hypothetical protein
MQKGERGSNILILALTRFTSREYKTPLMKHSLPISRARLIAASFKFLISQLSMVREGLTIVVTGDRDFGFGSGARAVRNGYYF